MIRPLRDLIVIRPLAVPGKVGLIHLPDLGMSSNKSGCVCEVIAAGPKVEAAFVGVKVHVPAYGSHPAGDEVVCEGETLTIIRERDINGIVP